MRVRGLIGCLGLALLATGACAQEAAGPPVHEKPEGEVARAQFTRGIVDREPVDRVTVLPNDETTLYYFTELRRLAGHTVLHRWRYKGQVLAEVAFKVGGPRWRVYSRKTLLPSQLGRWEVEVVDRDSGWPLRVDYFEYVAAPASSPEASSPEVGESTGPAGGDAGGSGTASTTTPLPASSEVPAASPSAGAETGPDTGAATGAASSGDDTAGSASSGSGSAGATDPASGEAATVP